MEITGMNDGNIYCVDNEKQYKIQLHSCEFVEVFSEASDIVGCELNTKTEFTSEQWRKFFSCYLVAKTNQQAGKLHSIIESFGGSDQEVKARKSVAFQLLGLKSLN